ncbi:MAG: lipoate--protein ligase family protein [Candidatus Methanomethylophilaceae archaeon]
MLFSDLGYLEPEESVRNDELLLKSHSSGGIPDVVCVYSRTGPAVSLGRSSVAEESVDLDYARRNGIAIVRRTSGGSAIFSDRSQITYVAVFSDDGAAREDVFRKVCNCIIHALAHINVHGEYKPVNDVLVDGRKISGSAQRRFRGSILQHGTLIVADDRRTMESVLIPLKKRSATTSLEEILGRIPGREEVVEALSVGFSSFDGSLEMRPQGAFFLL